MKKLILILCLLASPAYGVTYDTLKIQESDGDYTTLFDAEAGEGRDLVSIDTALIFLMSTAWTLPDTLEVSFEGWTCDATRNVKVVATGSARHPGYWSDTAYRRVTDGGTEDVEVLDCDFIVFEGIQFKRLTTGANLLLVANAPYISSCIFMVKGIDTFLDGVDSSFFWNNIFDSVGYGGTDAGISLNSENDPAYIYNNTFVDCGRGINFADSSKNSYIYNNIFANLNSYVLRSPYGQPADFDYNATTSANMSEATAGDSDRVGQTFTFVNESANNFHLAAGDTGAINHGKDLSGDGHLPFSDDVDGDTRSDWDIGADEYIAAEPAEGNRRKGLLLED